MEITSVFLYITSSNLENMIKDRLASVLGRRDEEPNIQLAQEIVQNKDKNAIEELLHLIQGKQKDLQNDSIKVLYEIGETSPQLISAYWNDFMEALSSKNNRLQWGAMTALKTISLLEPDHIVNNLIKLENAAEQGSVITRDNYVTILTNILSLSRYQELAFNAVIKQLLQCPTNQLAMYAELVSPKITSAYSKKFIETLSGRLDEIEKDSKRKRVEKVIKKKS